MSSDGDTDPDIGGGGLPIAKDGNVAEKIQVFAFFVEDERITTTGLIYKLFLQNNVPTDKNDPFHLGTDIDNATVSFSNITKTAPVSLAVRAMANDMYRYQGATKVNVIYISDMSKFDKKSLIDEQSYVCVIFQNTANFYFVPNNSMLEKVDNENYKITHKNDSNETKTVYFEAAWKIAHKDGEIKITKSFEGNPNVNIYVHKISAATHNNRHGDERIHRFSDHRAPHKKETLKINSSLKYVTDRVVRVAKDMANGHKLTLKIIDVWVLANENCLELHTNTYAENNDPWLRVLIQSWIRVVNFRKVTHPHEFRTNAFDLIKQVVMAVIRTAVNILKPNITKIDETTYDLFIRLFKDDEQESAFLFMDEMHTEIRNE